jgi:hypothetical protein
MELVKQNMFQDTMPLCKRQIFATVIVVVMQEMMMMMIVTANRNVIA